MRILHVAPQFAYFGGRTVVGGYARSLLDLAVEQSARHEVRICANLPNEHRHIEGTDVALLDVGAPRVPGSRRTGVQFMRSAVPSIWSQRAWADVVHVHSGYADYLVLSWLVKRLGLRRVVHSLYCPVTDMDDLGGALRRRVLQMACRGPDVVTGMSRNICSSVEAWLAAESVQWIPPALDSRSMLENLSVRSAAARRALHLDDAQVMVLFVGNTTPEKNLVGMLDAFAQVARSVPEAVLVVTTELSSTSPEHSVQDILRRARDLGIDDRIIHLSIVRDMAGLIGACDVLATPFLSTNGPSDYFMAAVEALVIGRPVVSSQVGGMAEIVGPGSGRLVAPGDTDGLASAVLDSLTQALPTEGSLAASRQTFDAASVARQFEQCYGAST